MKKETNLKYAQGASRLPGEQQTEGMAEDAVARETQEAMRSVTEAMRASHEAMRPVAEAMAAAESATAQGGGGGGDATCVYEIDATLFDISAGDRTPAAG